MADAAGEPDGDRSNQSDDPQYRVTLRPTNEKIAGRKNHYQDGDDSRQPRNDVTGARLDLTRLPPGVLIIHRAHRTPSSAAGSGHVSMTMFRAPLVSTARVTLLYMQLENE
jgi:hypothetical protein